MPAIHRLEQVSSEEKVGSLAENLMEALRDHPDVEKKVSATDFKHFPGTFQEIMALQNHMCTFWCWGRGSSVKCGSGYARLDIGLIRFLLHKLKFTEFKAR